jgi:hypothetical protein
VPRRRYLPRSSSPSRPLLGLRALRVNPSLFRRSKSRSHSSRLNPDPFPRRRLDRSPARRFNSLPACCRAFQVNHNQDNSSRRNNIHVVYEIAADLTALVHVAFIAFVIFGAVLGRRSRTWRLLHIAAMAYGVAIEVFYWYCPLTYVEQYLRTKAGRGMYQEAFVQHYLNKLVYIDAPQWSLIALAALVLLGNAALYAHWRTSNSPGALSRQ